jgi:hypothetical protein
VGDYLLFSDSVKFLEHCVKTISTGKTLANEVDYKLIASNIARQSGGQNLASYSSAGPRKG